MFPVLPRRFALRIGGWDFMVDLGHLTLAEREMMENYSLEALPARS